MHLQIYKGVEMSSLERGYWRACLDQTSVPTHMGDLGWAGSITCHLLMHTKLGLGDLPGRASPQYPPVNVWTGRGHARLGHGTNQYTRESSLGADSVGHFWAHPVKLQYPLICTRPGGNDRWS